MNYGYSPTPHDGELADRIEAYLKTVEPDARGMMPYVELDGLYPGVRVRRITHYTGEQQDGLVHDLDQIYEEVVPRKYWKNQHD